MVQRVADESRPSTAVLTFLIADVRGYTRFTRERGDAAAAILAKRFADLARDAVGARSGRVIELRGDEALAVFESPDQAVRAAVELQATCAEESEADPGLPLPVGIGIDSGEAVPVEDGYRGVALNMAARLCSNAAAGQVLVTRAIVEGSTVGDGEVRFVERGPASFKGFELPVDVIEAVPAHERTAPWPGELGTDLDRAIPPELDPLTPLVGRAHEMRWLRGTWRQVRRGRGRLVFVSGPAQIGKTRLAGEIAVHVHSDGGVIRYAGPGGAATAVALSAVRAAREVTTPTLLVLDDVDVAGPSVARELVETFDELSRRPVLVLALVRDQSAGPELALAIERANERGDGNRALAPFDLEGVRGIVRLYVGTDEAEAPVESMARASHGVPGRIHEVVSEWARSEASRRLAAAAEFLAAGRDRHASDLEFANNVIGLKLGRLYSVEGRDVLSVETCPYKGLAPFEGDDSAFFFGRERLVGELAARTVQVGLLGVVGASGSGKSSVIGAGLLPSLAAGLLPGSERWTQVWMRPGEHPMDALRTALLKGHAEGIAAGTADDGPIAMAMARLGPAGRLVLVVDQFEETFTMCATEPERDEFVRALTASASAWPERVVVILAIRGDFYASCAPYPELAEALGANHLLVGPLTRDELRRAIELPARRAGLRIESALVDSLVEEVAEEPGGLPLLSTALVELWQAREDGWIRMEAHQRTGGVRGAVARLAESSYHELTDPEREAARRVFLRLVAAGEGEAVTRRRVSLDEFDLDRDAASAGVLTRLTQDRLLTTGEGTVEVAHEALLREWPRLQAWLAEDAQGRQLRQHITQASRQWKDGGEEPSELYRGARLSAALDWSDGHAPELNELERDFLAASRQASDREADRQRRSNRRLRGLLVGVAVFLVVALVAGALALAQRGSARRSAGQAEASALAAEAQRLGAQSLVAKTPEQSLLLARQAIDLHQSEETQSTLLAALLRWQGALRIVHPNDRRLLRVALSPKDDWVAFSDNTKSLFVYDARTLQRIRVIEGFVDEMVASPDGRTLFVAFQPEQQGGVEQIKAFDARTGAVVWTGQGGNGLSGFDLSPDGSLLAIASDPRIDTPFGPRPAGKPASLMLRDAADGTVASAISLGDFRGVVFAGPNLVATRDGARIRLLDVRSGRLVRTIGGATDDGFAISSDGSTLALGQADGSVRLVEVKAGRRRLLTAPSTYVIDHLAFSPDGRTLGAAGGNGVVVTWDVPSGNATSLHGQTGNVTGIAFSADGRTMWTDGLDGTAVEWDLAGDRSLRRSLRGSKPAGTPDPSCLPFPAYSPDGSILAITGCDHRTRLFDGRTFRLVRALPKDSFECCMPPAIDRKVERMATVDGTGVDLWNPGDGTLIRHLYTSPTKPDPNGGPPPVDAQAITPDGNTVAANDGATVLLINADTGKVERRLDAGSYVVVVAFDPSGDLLEASTADGGVVVWDVRSGRRLWRRVVPGQSALGGFSNDGRLFATGTEDGQVVVFEARTGRPVGKPFVGDAGFVFSVSFNPRTGIVASTGSDGVVTLTDVLTRRQFGSPLTGTSEAFSAGVWSPSGAQYVVVGNDGNGYMWDMSVRDWEARACRTAGRSLTRDEWHQFLPDRPYNPAC